MAASLGGLPVSVQETMDVGLPWSSRSAAAADEFFDLY